MNAYQRFDAVCELKAGDRPPVGPLIMTFAARQAGMNYADYCRHAELTAQAQAACVRRFGYDSVTPTSDAVREAEALGAPVVWPENDVPATPDEPFVHDVGDLARLRLPDPLGANRMAEQVRALHLLQRDLGDEVVVFGWVESPFQEAGVLRNLKYFMTDLVDNPEFVHKLVRFTLQVELDFGLAQIEAGARYIAVGDAMASLVSPRTYREFNYPYACELIAGLKKAGARIKYHACGNTKALLPLFRDLGADIINLDARVDLALAKETLGDSVCLKGNLDPVRVLMNGTPEQVTAAAERCLNEGGPAGFILSPGCEVPPETPPENLEALVAVARRRIYP